MAARMEMTPEAVEAAFGYRNPDDYITLARTWGVLPQVEASPGRVPALPDKVQPGVLPDAEAALLGRMWMDGAQRPGAFSYPPVPAGVTDANAIAQAMSAGQVTADASSPSELTFEGPKTASRSTS